MGFHNRKPSLTQSKERKVQRGTGFKQEIISPPPPFFFPLGRERGEGTHDASTPKGSGPSGNFPARWEQSPGTQPGAGSG